MLDIFQQYRNIIITFTVLFAGLLIGYSAFTSITRAGKIEVTIRAVPSDAAVTLNGTKIQPGKLYLAPGRYTIAAVKNGFTTYNETSYLTPNLIPEINIAMTATSDTAKQWAKEHQSDYDSINEDIRAKTDGDKAYLKNSNPITSQLPFSNNLYTIDYAPDPDDPTGNSIMLTIDAVPGKRLSALYIIRQLGYDPTDYRIKFTNYTSMFQ